MHKFRELKIWQRAIFLAEDIYKITSLFPGEEKFGLISQLRRSVVSIASNIAEGAGRGTNNQFKQFLEFAMGSCNEVQTQIEIAKRLKYIEDQIAGNTIEQCFQLYKMILVFYNSLK